MLVGKGGDYVTAKASAEETAGSYTVYEVLSSPGFGPPLHRHAWQECFYVLEGEFDFSFVEGGELRTVRATPGTCFTIPAGAPHGFRNALAEGSRMLVIDQPVGVERMFDVHGVEVEAPGAEPAQEPLDPSRLAEILPRYGIELVEPPGG